MKKITLILLSLTLVASFIGCATTVKTNIAMKSSLNDFLAISTKTNSDLPISYYFRSNVKDGEVVARNPDFRNVIMSHTEATDFKKMLDEYMCNKFSKIHQNAESKIIITLADFYLDRKMIESRGSATMKLLGGQKIKQQLSVYVKVVAQVIYNGKEYVKNIISSEEVGYAAGMAVKEEESFEFVYGELINNANNKALMILNRFLEEIGV